MGSKKSRNNSGLTLPFALILTFIFSALVSVSYLFVSVNLSQMQSNMHSLQAILIAEGINERIKARLNTKAKIQPSPKQEEKLRTEEEIDEEEELEDEDLIDESFDEQSEDFDEYYADEVLKISRYITFREPPEPDPYQDTQNTEEQTQNLRPEANVEMIGSIDIPLGTTLTKGLMIVVYKDEKINLKLDDIVSDKTKPFREKLPVPQIKALIPNYSEANKRGNFVVSGENISYNQNQRFTNKEIVIEDVKAGPSVDFFIGSEVMSGATKFYWESAQANFYITPLYNGSSRPIINDIKTFDDKQLLEVKAGQKRLVIKISGLDLYQNKEPPVVIPDVNGISPKVKEYLPGGKEITVSLDIDNKVEPGSHSILVATEGGLSNSWIFSVLPPDEKAGDLGSNSATVTSSLTLLDIRVIENLLPLIDEEEDLEDKDTDDDVKQNTQDPDAESDEEDEPKEVSESAKLSPFANTDLELVWLLQTSSMVGKFTKTVSEIIHRQVPNVNAALITNGEITFDGGNYMILGSTLAMAVLYEPTYLSNTVLTLGPPPEEKTEQNTDPGQARPEDTTIKTPTDLGFTPGALVTVYKEGDRITELDYSIISQLGENTIELIPPGLMDFHYQNDPVFQFIPPVISKEKVDEETAERHLSPKDFTLNIPNSAMFNNIFRSNIEQFSELADLYTNDSAVPIDEFDLPLGYMGLSYVEGTPVYNNNNVLAGKGILIIDTRSDNDGKPIGEIEISGDSKNPVEISGLVYIHGNLRIDGNVTINGGLIVDNEAGGMIQISNNALGRISWDPKIIKQTLLSIPFTTKPGTLKISNKPIDISSYVASGSGAQITTGGTSGQLPQREVVLPGTTGQSIGATQGETNILGTVADMPPSEPVIETVKPGDIIDKRPASDYFPSTPGSKSAEEELIELF